MIVWQIDVQKGIVAVHVDHPAAHIADIAGLTGRHLALESHNS